MNEQFKNAFNTFTSSTQNQDEPSIDPSVKKAKRKKFVRNLLFLLVILLILTSVGNFVYFVREDEVATVRVLGSAKKIIVDRDDKLAAGQNELDDNFKDIAIVRDKGLFFKIPFITQVDKDTSKLITYISNTAEINTKDKIKYDVAMYAQWEITHPALFRSSYGTIVQANRKLDEVAYARVIEKINSGEIKDDYIIENVNHMVEEYGEQGICVKAALSRKDQNMLKAHIQHSGKKS